MTYQRLNFASGTEMFDSGWINLDIMDLQSHKDKHIFVRTDLTGRLPFDDGSADVIYTSHFLEHLDPIIQCHSFLVECFRVLKPKGILRISVPDFKKIVTIYLDDPKQYFEEYNYSKPWFTDSQGWTRRLGISIMHDHKMLYDIESLTEVLNEAGFSTILEINSGDAGFLTKEQINGIVPTHIGHSLIVDVKK